MRVVVELPSRLSVIMLEMYRDLVAFLALSRSRFSQCLRLYYEQSLIPTSSWDRLDDDILIYIHLEPFLNGSIDIHLKLSYCFLHLFPTDQ